MTDQPEPADTPMEEAGVGVRIMFLPSDTTEEAVQAVLGGTKVVLTRRNGIGYLWGYGTAYFPTREEAAAVAARPDVVIGGNRVALYIVGEGETKEAKARRLTEQLDLSVRVSGLPNETKESDLHPLFPNALRVMLQYAKGNPTGRAHVVFGTKAEAEAAVARGAVDVKGTACLLMPSGLPGEAVPHPYTVSLVNSHAGPNKIAAVRAAFPAARLVRTLNNRIGCTYELTFASEAETSAVLRQGKVEIDGDVLKVVPGACNFEEELARTLFVSGCDPTMTEKDLRRAFPKCDGVRLIQPRARAAKRAYVRFPTAELAQEVAAEQEVAVGTATLRVEMAVTRAEMKERAARKRKRQEEKGKRRALGERPAKRRRTDPAGAAAADAEAGGPRERPRKTGGKGPAPPKKGPQPKPAARKHSVPPVAPKHPKTATKPPAGKGEKPGRKVKDLTKKEKKVRGKRR